MNATPRPWRYNPTILGVPSTTIMSGDEQVGYAAVGHFLEANANLIVTAVNAYDPQLVAKVAAYEAFVIGLKEAVIGLKYDGVGHDGRRGYVVDVRTVTEALDTLAATLEPTP